MLKYEKFDYFFHLWYKCGIDLYVYIFHLWYKCGIDLYVYIFSTYDINVVLIYMCIYFPLMI